MIPEGLYEFVFWCCTGIALIGGALLVKYA